ncbi:MAG: hypothetical protein GXY36_19675 [Chloroflexi bacterium]|nr:hypothetical protein [Chloroflexota bacterium]
MHSTRPASTPYAVSYDDVRCPAQVLVVDRVNGPANVLVDTVSLLLGPGVSVTSVSDHADALRALECCAFDLVVVGVEAQRPTQLAILPHLRVQAPELPVLVVGRDLPEPTVERARRYQAHEVIELPARAADLRDLVAHLALHYLAVAPAV